MSDTKQSSALARFRSILDPAGVLAEPQEMAPYLYEWRDKYTGSAAAVLRPASVDDIVKIVRIANEEGIGLVPQGGNTGLVGGQTAFDAKRQFVVSLSRLDRIRAIDPAGYTITVEAGTILQNVQDTANDAGLLFPLSLGSEGTCQIGGNLSSNAGGTGALAYGTARDLTLGLEVVLPNGEIYRGLNRLKKDNTGYDLKNLFIGAEGTLGFITAAVLKLFPKPRGTAMAFLGFSDLDAVAGFYTRAQSHGGAMLTAFEIVPRIGIEFLVKHVERARDPLQGAHPWYVLAEISSGRSGEHAESLMMELLEDGMECGEIADGTIAASEAQRRAFWYLRHELSGCQKPEGGSIKHDVSVPVANIPAFIEETSRAVTAFIPGCRPVPFGHWGDGNIHFNVSQPVGMAREAFLGEWERMNDLVHDIALSHDGSISAEHGIGVMKRATLARTKDPVALSLMRRIKATLDPNGIMNPGKVL